jgi:hypothetical protein
MQKIQNIIHKKNTKNMKVSNTKTSRAKENNNNMEKSCLQLENMIRSTII